MINLWSNIISPGGAKVNSQGDQPTGRCPPLENAFRMFVCRPSGALLFLFPKSRGSRPWLLTAAPAGA